MTLDIASDGASLSLGEKLARLPWSFVTLITLVACIGFAMLYSAANGQIDPWASRQMLRFGIGLLLMLFIGLVDIRIWMKMTYPLYGLVMALLIGVDLFGSVGKGAQRWIDLGFVQLQPSEIMKVTLMMALARYFHGASLEDTGRIPFLIVPLAIVGAPVGLVLAQPNLGTAMMLIMASGSMFFLSGVRWWKFALVIAAVLIAIPLSWQFVLHDYQRDRVETFLNPDSDPLGTGYHITQSKIAFGSGGLTGKGFLQGTQSHLNFLPEKQTDFIFTMLAEEFGLVGSISFLVLFCLMLLFGFVIAGRCRHQYGRLLTLGLTVNLFLYLFINVAMIMGLIPVVGVPLPLISYGGTATLGVMVGFGLMMSVHVHRDVRMSRRGIGDL